MIHGSRDDRRRRGAQGLFGLLFGPAGGTGTQALDATASMLLETGAGVDDFVLQEDSTQIYLE